MMASIVKYLILALLFTTMIIASALPVNTELYSEQLAPGSCAIDLYKDNATSESRIFVPNNGTLFNPNPSASLIECVCIESDVPSCAFGAEDGTWIAAYNSTDYGCVEISPPLVLNNGFCCVSLDDCALLDQLFLLARKEHPTTTLTLASVDGGSQHMTVPNDGSLFSFNATNREFFQACVSDDTTGCVFQAPNGTAYTANNLGSSSCVNINPTMGLDHGFCCKDFHHCYPLTLPNEVLKVEHSSRSLQTRGAIVNKTLDILYEGSPNLVGWEVVLTNFQGFNVTDKVPWAVGQICLMSETALCAFVGQDGTDTVVIGGQNGNCAVVGPPQILIDGCCCNSYSECDTSEKDTIARIAGPTVMASILSTNGTSNTIVASNTTMTTRAADVAGDVTIQYWGAGDAYDFQLVDGGYNLFTPLATWGVDQVCIVTPQGFCGFWNADESLGFEVGPVAEGQSGACYTVGGAYVLAGGICCRSSDGCNSKRSIEPLSVRDNAASVSAAAVTRYITFYGDPAVYVAGGGVETYLQVPNDGKLVSIPAFGQPAVQVCLNSGSCQFWEGDATGPAIKGGNGGCLMFDSSITLSFVACA